MQVFKTEDYEIWGGGGGGGGRGQLPNLQE